MRTCTSDNKLEEQPPVWIAGAEVPVTRATLVDR